MYSRQTVTSGQHGSAKIGSANKENGISVGKSIRDYDLQDLQDLQVPTANKGTPNWLDLGASHPSRHFALSLVCG